MKQLDIVAATLVIIGALNWGLVAIARFDLVAALFGMQFGETSALSAAVYGLVGWQVCIRGCSGSASRPAGCSRSPATR